MLTRGAKRKASALEDISSYPGQIIIVRHGEKMMDKKGKELPKLSADGIKRANYLAAFFAAPSENIQIPNYIYSYSTGMGDPVSRGELLMEPLARNLGLRINTSFKINRDEKDMVKHIFDNCRDQCVIICWDHVGIINDIIPAIASLINADFSRFVSWNWNPLDARDHNSELYSLVVVVDPKIKLLKTITEDFQDFPPDDQFIPVSISG